MRAAVDEACCLNGLCQREVTAKKETVSNKKNGEMVIANET